MRKRGFKIWNVIDRVFTWDELGIPAPANGADGVLLVYKDARTALANCPANTHISVRAIWTGEEVVDDSPEGCIMYFDALKNEGWR